MSYNNAKPALFNTEMVKAILDGRKTQTRRVIIKEYLGLADIDGNNIYIEDNDGNHFNILETTWAKYKIGDVLWVREPAKVENVEYEFGRWHMKYRFLADDFTPKYLKIPKRFIYQYSPTNLFSKKWIEQKEGVPNGCIKEMARIFLKVTNVRVERLQDMNLKDECGTINIMMHKRYVDLWNSTAKDGYKWEDNPYVFVYNFEVLEIKK